MSSFGIISYQGLKNNIKNYFIIIILIIIAQFFLAKAFWSPLTRRTCSHCTNRFLTLLLTPGMFTTGDIILRNNFSYPNFNSSNSSNNKFAQSNLGRGPRFSTVVHVCRKVSIGYNLQWRSTPNSPPKVPLSIHRSLNPTTCLIPGPVRLMIPNNVRVRSAVFPQCTGQTNRSSTGKIDDYRPLRYESDVT